MKNIKPLRLCENCGYLLCDGYEYPEPYCGVGISEDDPLYVGDGCIYTDRQLRIIYDVHAEWESRYEAVSEAVPFFDLSDIFE